MNLKTMKLGHTSIFNSITAFFIGYTGNKWVRMLSLNWKLLLPLNYVKRSLVH